MRKTFIERLQSVAGMLGASAALFAIGYVPSAAATEDEFFGVVCGVVVVTIAWAMIGLAGTGKKSMPFKKDRIRDRVGFGVLFVAALAVGGLVSWWKVHQTSKMVPLAKSDYGIFVAKFARIGPTKIADPEGFRQNLFNALRKALDDHHQDVYATHDSASFEDAHQAKTHLKKINGECLVWGTVNTYQPKWLLETSIEFNHPFLEKEQLKELGIVIDTTAEWNQGQGLPVRLQQELISRMRCTISIGIGVLKYQRADYSGAIAILHEAVTNCKLEGAEDNAPYIYFFLTMAYYKQGDKEKAENNWLVMKMAPKVKEKLGPASTWFDGYFGTFGALADDNTDSLDEDRIASNDRNVKGTDDKDIAVSLNPFGPTSEISTMQRQFEVFRDERNDLCGVRRIRDQAEVVAPSYEKIWISTGGFFIANNIATRAKIAGNYEIMDSTGHLILQKVNDIISENLGWSLRDYPFSIETGGYYLGWNWFLLDFGTIRQKKTMQYMSTNGQIIPEMPFQTRSTIWINEGYANFQSYELVVNNGKTAIIRFQPFVLTEYQYDQVEKGGEKLLIVKQNGHWGFLDLNCNIAIPCIYDYVTRPTSRSFQVKRNNRWGLLDSEGKVLLETVYDSVPIMLDRRSIVKKHGLYGYVDKKGMLVIEPRFDNAREFEGGFAVVHDYGGWGIINEAGMEVVPCQFAYVSKFTEGLAIVKAGAKLGYYNTQGNPLGAIGYDHANPFHKGLAIVGRKGKYGVIDRAGKMIVPIEFTKIEFVNNDRYIIGRKRGTLKIFDLKGNHIPGKQIPSDTLPVGSPIKPY